MVMFERPAALVAQDAGEVPAAEHRLHRPSPLLGAGHLPGEADQEHVRRVVGAERQCSGSAGILHAGVDRRRRPARSRRRCSSAASRCTRRAPAAPARSAARAPASSAWYWLLPVGTPRQMMLLVLRKLPQRLRDVAVEARIRRRDAGACAQGRIDVRLQHAGAEREHARIVHVRVDAERLRSGGSAGCRGSRCTRRPASCCR